MAVPRQDKNAPSLHRQFQKGQRGEWCCKYEKAYLPTGTNGFSFAFRRNFDSFSSMSDIFTKSKKKITWFVSHWFLKTNYDSLASQLFSKNRWKEAGTFDHYMVRRIKSWLRNRLFGLGCYPESPEVAHEGQPEVNV